jgi:hypothetical protein
MTPKTLIHIHWGLQILLALFVVAVSWCGYGGERTLCLFNCLKELFRSLSSVRNNNELMIEISGRYIDMTFLPKTLMHTLTILEVFRNTHLVHFYWMCYRDILILTISSQMWVIAVIVTCTASVAGFRNYIKWHHIPLHYLSTITKFEFVLYIVIESFEIQS